MYVILRTFETVAVNDVLDIIERGTKLVFIKVMNHLLNQSAKRGRCFVNGKVLLKVDLLKSSKEASVVG